VLSKDKTHRSEIDPYKRQGRSRDMPKISFQKKDIPFLLEGAGQLSLDTGGFQLNKPIDAGTLLKANFDLGTDPKIMLGKSNTVKLGVTATTSVELIPIFSSTQGAPLDVLAANGMGKFFDNPASADMVVLAFNVGGTAQVTAAGSLSR
jgi:hypothetical protein